MALITRVSKLFTADMHAVLDRLEEPEALLKQAIREMADEIAKGETRLKWLVAEVQQLDKRVVQTANAVTELDLQLDSCFDADEDELARAVVRRKLSAQRRATMLEVQRDETKAAVAALETTLDEQRGQLAELQTHAEVLVDDNVQRGGYAHDDLTVTNDEVDVALLRERRRRMGS